MTAGWRSPLGGPRYDGDIPGDDRDEPVRANEWDEQRIEEELLEHERAKATVEPQADDGDLRADGGAKLRDGEHRDDDNVHRLRNERQLEMAAEYLDDDDNNE